MGDRKPRAWRPGDGISRRDFLGSAALAASGSALLGACSGGDRASDGRAQLTFLTILPPETLTFAPELLAEAGGFFAASEVDVRFELTRGSAQAINLVLADRAALTRISQVEGMRAAANSGAELLNVGMSIKNSTIRFVSSEQDPLREPQDFVGKLIGIPSTGGSSELELDLFLAGSGVDPATVQRQVVGLTPAVFSMVEHGRIAGYAVSIDTAKILEKQQPTAVVVNPGDYMVSGGQFYMAAAREFERHRDAIERFLRAVDGALEFMLEDENFDRTLEVLRSRYSFDGLNDTEIAKASLTEYRRSWTDGGREALLRTEPTRWSRGYQELVDAGLVATGEMPDDWFTNELVDGL